MPTLGWDRAYRSGDLVKLELEGLLFQGRADDQIKLGGRRIELGEIDNALQSLPGVGGAADDGGGRERLALGGVELFEAAGDHQTHSLGDLGLADLETGLPPSRVVEELSGLTQMPVELLDEERIALRLREHEIDQLGRCRHPRPRAQHRLDLGFGEEAGPEVECADSSQQRSDRGRQRPTGLELVIPALLGLVRDGVLPLARFVDALTSENVTINLSKSGDHRLSAPDDIALLVQTVEMLIGEIEA